MKLKLNIMSMIMTRKRIIRMGIRMRAGTRMRVKMKSNLKQNTCST